MYNMEAVTPTLVVHVIDDLREYANDLEAGNTPHQSEKEHLAFYAKMLDEAATMLKTASIMSCDG